MRAPACENEVERLVAPESYQILDTPGEEEFDGLTRLIARRCDVNFAVVNLIAAVPGERGGAGFRVWLPLLRPNPC